MPGKPFRFVVVFEGHLDMIPGTFYTEADFHRMATEAFMRQSHYGVKATIIESTDARDVFGGWPSNNEGWIETNREPVEFTEAVQFRSDDVNIEPEWFEPGTVIPDASWKVITHYRKRKPTEEPNPDADAGSHYAFSQQS